jgi:hypothetical protein
MRPNLRFWASGHLCARRLPAGRHVQRADLPSAADVEPEQIPRPACWPLPIRDWWRSCLRNRPYRPKVHFDQNRLAGSVADDDRYGRDLARLRS